MNEIQNNTVNVAKSRTTFSLIAGFIVVLVLVSVVAYRAGIDPKQIKADVAGFAQKISDRYAKRGLDVKLEYADIAVNGGIFEKSIVLQNASVAVKGKNADYKLIAPAAKIVPSDSSFDEFEIELAYPVKMLRNNETFEVSYDAKTPLKINVMLNEGGQREYSMSLPMAAELNVKNGDSTTKYNVTNNDASFVTGAFSEDIGDPYSVEAAIEELKIASDGLEISAKSASFGSASEAEIGQFELNVIELSSTELPKSLGVIDVNISQKSQTNAETKEDDVDIELFSISGDGFDLNLKGRVGFREQELLPIANINVVANGLAKVFAALSETEYFAPKQKTITIQAIKMIAPDWNEFSLSPLQFDVRRDENAPFVIGKVKADELFAMILQQYLQLQNVVEPAAVDVPAVEETPLVVPTEAEAVETEATETPEAQ